MSERDERIIPGRVYREWLGGGAYRLAKVIDIDQDGMATITYPDYPQLGVSYTNTSNLS